MKTLLFTLSIFLFFGCKNITNEPLLSQSELFEKMKGTWNPYETVSKDGQVKKGQFLSFLNTFGSYAGGFKMDKNENYFPVSWIDSSNFIIKTDEKGTVTYSSGEKKLIFNGVWKLEYELEKIDNNDLWIKDESGSVLKMERVQ